MIDGEAVPQQVKDYYNKGLFAFEKKNYDYAIELFSQAVSLKKDFADARNYLHLSAQRKFQKNKPNNFGFLLQMIKNLPALVKGIIADIKNQPQLAIDNYEELLKSDPNNTYILVRLAQDLLNTRDYLSAIKTFELIRCVDPTNITSLKNLAKLYSQNDNYAKSRECYQSILKFIPHEAEAEKGLKNLDALGTIKDSFGPDANTNK